MKPAVVFLPLWIGIESVIEPNRTDGQLIAQAEPERISHLAQTRTLSRSQKIAGIEEGGPLQLAIDGERVFDIEHRIKFAPDRIVFRIVRAEVAFAEAADGSCAAVKKALVDRDGGWLVRPGMI